MPKTQNEHLFTVTAAHLASLDLANPPAPAVLEADLIRLVNAQFMLENAMRDKSDRMPLLRQLTFSQVAQVLVALHRVVRVAPNDKNTDRDYDLLAIYMADGPDAGIYATSEDQIRSIARRYNRELTINGAREVMTVLREEAPRVVRCDDRDLIAVNNGVFDYRTKELHPHDPARVFLAKSRVDYVSGSVSPVIQTPDGDDWEVEAWMQTLSDDPEIVELLWEVLGAIVRPYVSWNKSAWFYSEQGNNGKGTLCELMRNLVGPSSYASIPIADFGKDFLLEPLTRASAIIVDENDVGTFIDRAANLKAVITNDVISINRKYKMPIPYQFYGFMVQCLNEFPRIKDTSESFYRRQLFVKFEKTFTGRERKYIKDDYLHRPEVLQYVLHRVLHMDYYALSEPEATKDVLTQYKSFNDPVRSFWEEHGDDFVWDLLPFPFLYELFKEWFVRNNPSGKPLGRNGFIDRLVVVTKDSLEWSCDNKEAKHRPGLRMHKAEPLIARYDLKGWMNQSYTGTDLAKRCQVHPLAANYRGLVRTGTAPAAVTAGAPAGAPDTTSTASDEHDATTAEGNGA